MRFPPKAYNKDLESAEVIIYYKGNTHYTMSELIHTDSKSEQFIAVIIQILRS